MSKKGKKRAKKENKNDKRVYKNIKKLGEGSFGKAYLVRCLNDDSLCVIKQMDLKKMAKQERKITLKEAKILELLIHPNIIRFREVYKTVAHKLCIVMDFADSNYYCLI